MAQDDPLHALVASVFDADAADIDDASSPETVPGWDSLGHLRLVNTLEERLDTELDPDDLFDLETVGDIRGLLERLGVSLAAGGAPTPSAAAPS